MCKLHTRHLGQQGVRSMSCLARIDLQAQLNPHGKQGNDVHLVFNCTSSTTVAFTALQ
jgi:hypothetical protein